MSSPTPSQASPLSPVEQIDTFAGGKIREVLDRIEAIHHRKTGGYCDAGRAGTECTGASCDITAAANHLPQGIEHTVESWIRDLWDTKVHTVEPWIRDFRDTKVHTVEVVAGGPSHAWTDRSIEVDEATSFRSTGANGHQKRYGLQGAQVLASDRETLLVSDGHEMALFVAAGAGARYAQRDYEHSERMRALR